MVMRKLTRLALGAVGQKEKSPAIPPDAMPVTRDGVIWALRLFVGRNPVNDAEIALHQQHATMGELRTSLMLTPEFKTIQVRVGSTVPGFAIPPFLARPPEDPAIPFRFDPPKLANPTSQLCTASQFEEPAFAEFMAGLKLVSGHHRKLWEHAYILSVLSRMRLIGPRRKAIGFGCGRERIPAYLAARGVEVLATDAPSDETVNQG
jgi:hypothetical protein